MCESLGMAATTCMHKNNKCEREILMNSCMHYCCTIVQQLCHNCARTKHLAQFTHNVHARTKIVHAPCATNVHLFGACTRVEGGMMERRGNWARMANTRCPSTNSDALKYTLFLPAHDFSACGVPLSMSHLFVVESI